MREGHYGAGAALALGVGLALGAGPVEVALTTLATVPLSGGRWSPDADQRMRVAHRGITHWPGWPLLWLAPCWALDLPLPLWAPGLAFASHVLADMVFGCGGRDIRRGVPVFPWNSRLRIGGIWKVTGPLMGHSVPELLGTLFVWALAIACTSKVW